jgi:hypothetical protein
VNVEMFGGAAESVGRLRRYQSATITQSLPRIAALTLTMVEQDRRMNYGFNVWGACRESINDEFGAHLTVLCQRCSSFAYARFMLLQLRIFCPDFHHAKVSEDWRSNRGIAGWCRRQRCHPITHVYALAKNRSEARC